MTLCECNCCLGGGGGGGGEWLLGEDESLIDSSGELEVEKSTTESSSGLWLRKQEDIAFF